MFFKFNNKMAVSRINNNQITHNQRRAIMLRNTICILTIFILAASFGLAQNKNAVQTSKAAIDMVDGSGVHNPNPASPQAAVLITKMWNAYTTQASYTNQIYFDPWSKLLGVVHRVDLTGAGSGRIVYNVSDDLGANWSLQIGPMNYPGRNAGRHPNIALSNPTHSVDPADVSVLTSWAELSSSWFWIVFSSDATPGGGTPVSILDSTYYPGDEMFVAENGYGFGIVPKIDYGTNGENNDLFTTTDKGATWAKTAFSTSADFEADTWNGTKGDFDPVGSGYIMVQGQKPGEPFYTFALKHSADNGMTWDANWSWFNPYTDAAYEGGRLGDSVHALNYEVDFITYGATGEPVFAGTFVDTVDGSATGIYVLIQKNGVWEASLARKVNATSLALPGGLSTLNEVQLARSVDGKVLALTYADLPTEVDTLYDQYVRWYNGATWSTEKNLTNTPLINEKYSQLASRLDKNGDDYQAYLMYTIFGGNDWNDLGESELWLLDNVKATVIVVGVNDNQPVVNSFDLSQNYPNPFNPSTLIKFSIAERSNVTLKVFDMLGREVATLLNTTKDAGSHEVSFDASNLASGLYVYTLSAGNFTSSKKMMLMK